MVRRLAFLTALASWIVAAQEAPQQFAERFRDAAVSQAESVATSLPSAESLTELKPLGQVSASFIVAVNGEGLWIVDQHVAHERVLFEQHLLARRAGVPMPHCS